MSRDPAEAAYRWKPEPDMVWMGEERAPWLEESEDDGYWSLCVGTHYEPASEKRKKFPKDLDKPK